MAGCEKGNHRGEVCLGRRAAGERGLGGRGRRARAEHRGRCRRGGGNWRLHREAETSSVWGALLLEASCEARICGSDVAGRIWKHSAYWWGSASSQGCLSWVSYCSTDFTLANPKQRLGGAPYNTCSFPMVQDHS